MHFVTDSKKLLKQLLVYKMYIIFKYAYTLTLHFTNVKINYYSNAI